MRWKFLSLFIIVLTVFLASGAYASISPGNKTYNIDVNYAPGEKLRGWINISLQQESADSLLSNNLNSSKITLKDFLEANDLAEEGDYTCIPGGCGKSYIATNPDSKKSFALSYSEERIISFKLNENIRNITGIGFDVSANNEKICMNPLEIDFFDFGLKWKSKFFSDDFSCTYETGTGCFNQFESTSEIAIDSTHFCEKIKLLEGSKFKLGAWVKNGTTAWSDGLLKMQLWGLSDTQPIASCNLPSPPNGGGEIGCIAYYNNTQIREFYVCIKASQETNYSTKREDVNSCGFYGQPPGPPEKHDYYIFASAAKFNTIGKFRFDQQEYSKYTGPGDPEKFSQYILNYIDEEYGRNCTSGCVIPIKFRAYGSFDIEVSNLIIAYSTDAGPQPAENKTYDTAQESGKISSDFLNLDLSLANISLPSSLGNRSLVLSLGDNIIFSKNIFITGMPVINNVLPTSVPAGVAVKFTAIISSGSKNISVFKWDFGDESEEETTNNSVMHAYSLGSHTLTLTVKDTSGLETTKEFEITAVNPKDVANLTIKKYRSRIDGITSKIGNYGAWYKKSLDEAIGINEMDDGLRALERKFTIASTDEDFASIMSNLTEMNVPLSLEKSQETNDFPLVVSAENVEPKLLEELGAGEYENGSEEEYRTAIEDWANSNLDLTADIFTLSLNYEDHSEPILNYFKLKIIPKEEKEIENYFVINEKAIVNSGDVKELSDEKVGIKFNSLESREIEFVILGSVDPREVPLVISPEFSKIEISALPGICNNDGKCDKERGESWKNCRNDCTPIARILIYLGILIFAAFIAYIILQEWYKRKYESHLFKNRNDLFNLVNFINNALSKGMGKDEIAKRLKQYKWSSEQIAYAFKKVKGKKTGMPLEVKFPEFKVNK